ncbi:Ycf51 family protein [Synechococcus sp. UW105]|uniref:Ycf51 family protein n=1 Tax=Synechococcus sp. UW105 TaxID=337067 RepID=UPI000E0EFDE1|nr:Ycf51 family protein [Synechococcus sp. UW105]
MNLPLLLQSSTQWLVWSGLGFAVVTAIAFAARWGLRFRLVGVTSFTLLLAASSWAFSVSYTPPVAIEGAVRAPVVFDNGNDLVVAKASPEMDLDSVDPTLQQLAGNLRPGGRSSDVVIVRLRQLQPAGDGLSKPVVLGQTEVKTRASARLNKE